MDEGTIQGQIQAADRLYAIGESEAALKAYQSVIAADPSQSWAYSRVGALLAQKGDLDEAERALNRAIELNPRLAQAHSNLGNVMYARGDYAQALAKYKHATELAPDNPVFHQNLHAAYKKLGRLQEAVAALKHAHRLERAQGRDEASRPFRELGKGRGCLAAPALLLILMVISVTILT